MISQKSKMVRKEDVVRGWHLVDADGQVLGRLATRVAWLLTGKGKPEYSPHVDCGDHVVVINAGKVRVTGRKLVQKVYHHHSGYLGGLKSEALGTRLARKPARVIEDAVAGMVPKTRLGRRMVTRLKVYAGPEHRHAAQKPAPVAP